MEPIITITLTEDEFGTLERALGLRKNLTIGAPDAYSQAEGLKLIRDKSQISMGLRTYVHNMETNNMQP